MGTERALCGFPWAAAPLPALLGIQPCSCLRTHGHMDAQTQGWEIWRFPPLPTLPAFSSPKLCHPNFCLKDFMGIPAGSHGRRGFYSLGNVRQMRNNSDGLGSFIPFLWIILGWTAIPTAVCILQVFCGMGGLQWRRGIFQGLRGCSIARGHRRNLYIPPAWRSNFSSHCHLRPSFCCSLRICTAPG